ncbi:MAG: hypothetical protein M0Z69_15095 [Actinomycetota bacterium]|nr:hypothetical protein [Actinomycetota bacterium]
MNLPIDLARVRFMAADDPSPAIDWKTKEQKVSSETGEVLWRIRALVSSEGARSEVISITVPGEPKGLRAFGHFKPIGLRASTFETTDGGHGFSYRADKIQLEGGAKS